jgi:chemotaxis signal transduction protein
MSNDEMRTRWREHVEEMRRAFDLAFAAPVAAPVADLDDFIAIRVGARPLAFRVVELVRLEVGCKVVALPTDNPWLRGLATIQGKLIPVYDLELALGFGQAPGERSWLALCGREEPFGLAFDALEGYFRVSRTEILGIGTAESAQKREHQAVRGAGEVRPVVHLPSILAAIRARVSSHSIAKEV